MKRFFITLAVLLLVYPVFASSVIKFSESVLPYKGGLLISNFGSVSHRVKSEDENNGYILYYKNNKIRSFISADGNLKTPTATAVYKKKLFVCDGDRLWEAQARKMMDACLSLIGCEENGYLGRDASFAGWQPEQINHTSWDYFSDEGNMNGTFGIDIAWVNVLGYSSFLSIAEDFPDILSQ